MSMKVSVLATNSDGVSEEKGSLEIVHQFSRFLDRWNTNEEAAKYLVSVEYHPEWMSKEPASRPASGQMFIFDKREVKFKKDGYSWKRRKDGRTPREDHMRLKVFGVELLYGCYAHSADSATFHRRSYWLLQKPETVLVHYLDVPTEDKGLCTFSDTDLFQLVMSKPCLVDKLRHQLSVPPTISAPLEPRIDVCGYESFLASIEISDFCPDWSYDEGGTKMVITGVIPDSAEYGIAFGDKFVLATVVQTGVLRCFCPAHPPGLVPLQLYCNTVPVAKPAVFDYKLRQPETAAYTSTPTPTPTPSLFQPSPGPSSLLVDNDIHFKMDDMMSIEADSPFEQSDPVSFSFASSSLDTGTCDSWPLTASPLGSDSSQHTSNSGPGSWVLAHSSPHGSESSLHAAEISATSSMTSLGSIFDDPSAPSVAEWCAVLGDGRSVLQQDFERLDLTNGEQQQLFYAASTIQSAFRKYRQRSKEVAQQNNAAILIQNWYRRYRRDLQSKKEERLQVEAETLAAMKIQRFLRRSLTLRKRHMNQWARDPLHLLQKDLSDSVLPCSLSMGKGTGSLSIASSTF